MSLTAEKRLNFTFFSLKKKTYEELIFLEVGQKLVVGV